MNKHKSNKIKENSNTVRHLIMGQITTTQNLVAIKEVRHAGQWLDLPMKGLTGTHFTNGLWAHNPNLVKTYVALLWNWMTWSGHNFAHAMTAKLSWHLQICDLNESWESKSEQNEFSGDFNYEIIDLLYGSLLFRCRGIFPVLSHGASLIHDPKGIVHGERSETNDPSCSDSPLRYFDYQLISLVQNQIW